MLAWAKRTSRVIDCEAIGGSGGWTQAGGDENGREVGDPPGHIWGCESLLAAVEIGQRVLVRRTALEELRLIDLYAEVIQQTSAAGLFH